MHPLQPIYLDEHGTPRFRKNNIVDFLLENGGYSLNELATKGFSNEDWEQFAQLIGYSISGFGELNYVSDRAFNKADRLSTVLLREEQSTDFT